VALEALEGADESDADGADAADASGITEVSDFGDDELEASAEADASGMSAGPPARGRWRGRGRGRGRGAWRGRARGHAGGWRKNQPNPSRQAAFEGDTVRVKAKPALGIAAGEQGVVVGVARPSGSGIRAGLLEYSVEVGDRLVFLTALDFKVVQRGGADDAGASDSAATGHSAGAPLSNGGAGDHGGDDDEHANDGVEDDLIWGTGEVTTASGGPPSARDAPTSAGTESSLANGVTPVE
jgi:hypothetical protein